MTLIHTVIRDDLETDVEIELTYFPATRGARDSFGGIRGAGPPLEPDEPATFEVEAVRRCDNGEPLELTSYEEEQIIEKALDLL